MIHAAATWAMVGVIWTIQLLQYPQMADVPHDAFADFELKHQRRVSRVLALFAPLEMVTGALIVVEAPDDPLRWIAGAILAAIWVSTGFFYAPLHGRLAGGFDEALHRRLVVGNWARTVGWTLRGVLIAAVLM